MTGETPVLSLGIMLTGGKKPNITPFLGCLRTTCHKTISIHSKNFQHIFINTTTHYYSTTNGLRGIHL
jgi:hypothetical protein